MEVISMLEALERSEEVKAVLEADGVIVFPTDTIYGVGSSAFSEKGLGVVRSLKERWGKPFSIIAPSKDWIRERFDLGRHEDWLGKLPGPFTLVFEPREPFSRQLSSSGAVGVRIPDHPIASFVEKMGVPLVATSVNRSGFDPLSSLDQLRESSYERFSKVAFAIDDGVKSGPASTVVDLTGERPVYVRM